MPGTYTLAGADDAPWASAGVWVEAAAPNMALAYGGVIGTPAGWTVPRRAVGGPSLMAGSSVGGGSVTAGSVANTPGVTPDASVNRRVVTAASWVSTSQVMPDALARARSVAPPADVTSGPAVTLAAGGGSFGGASGASVKVAYGAGVTTTMLTGSAGGPITFVAGGAAPSVQATGNVGVTGSYAVGGALTVGVADPDAGVLVIAAGATVTAGTLAVPNGLLRLLDLADVVVTGAVSVGEAAAMGATGSVCVGTGATLAASGALGVLAGGLTDAAGWVSIGGNATIGVAGSAGSFGRIAVTGGGRLAVGGLVSAPDGMLVADGTGSSLCVTGTVTTGKGGSWLTAAGNVPGAVVAVNGGTVQVGGLVLAPGSALPLANAGVTVDAGSVIEVGSAGGATAGALTIDAGRVVSAQASVGINGALVDNGTLVVAAGTLTQGGAVSGGGTIVIDSGATWQVGGAVGTGDTIVFAGSHAALALGAGATVAGTLAGFVPGDTIVVAGSVTSASLAAGTLTLNGTAGVLETFRLAGTQVNEGVALRAAAGGGTAVQLAPVGGGAASGNHDVFAWSGASVGTWAASGDWQDVTAQVAVPSTVPGGLTPVVVDGTRAGLVSVQGSGSAASLAVVGRVALSGTYAVGGSLTVGTLSAGSAPMLTGGSLTVSAQTTISAGSLAVLEGGVSLLGGGTIAGSGTVSVGFAGGYQVANAGTFANAVAGMAVVGVAAGARLSAGGLWVQDGTLADSGVVTAGSLTVGSVGGIVSMAPLQTVGSARGTVTVGAGGTLSVAGGIAAQAGMVVADGGSLVAGGTLVTGVGGVYSYIGTSGFPQVFDGALVAINGGFVRAGGLVLADGAGAAGAPAGQTAVFVGATSTIEVGSAGSAAAGALTIDPGRSVVAQGCAEIEGNLVDNGLLLVNAGTLVESGQVSGSGTIGIARGAALVLDGAIGPSGTIGFGDTGGMLVVGGQFSFSGSGYALAGLNLNAVVNGFQPGDAIAVLEPVNGVGFSAGTLTLSENGSPMEVIRLGGSFAGDTFALSYDPIGDAVVSVLAPASGGAVSGNADAFAWAGGSVGAWGTAGNWRDMAAGGSAVAAPGSLTAVTLGGTEVVSGGGVAGSVAVTGRVGLTGRYAVGGALTVGSAGSLEVTSGGVVTAGSVVVGGVLALDAAATLAVRGTVSLGATPGGAAGTLDVGMAGTLSAVAIGVGSGVLSDVDGVVSVGGPLLVGSAGSAGVVAVRAGGSLAVGGGIAETQGIVAADGAGSVVKAGGTLLAQGGGVYSSASLASGCVAASLAAVNGGTVVLGGVALSGGATGLLVDSESAIEVGTAGNASAGNLSAGAVTVDPGAVISSGATATIGGSLVNNGTVVVSSAVLTQAGGVSGNGTVVIDAGAMWVNQGRVAAGQTILFHGSGGVLFDAGGPMLGVIGGFGAGDTLVVAGPVMTAAFVAGIGSAPGTLVLSDAGATVGSFLLAAPYAGQSFVVTPGYGGSMISLAPTLGMPGVVSAEGGRLRQAGTGWTLDLGIVAQGSSGLSDRIGVENIGPVGTLSGRFSVSGAAAFGNLGFGSGFSGLGAGVEEAGQTISLSAASAGVFSETIVMSPTSGATVLAAQTIAVTGTVVPVGTVVSVGAAAVSVTGGAGNDVFNAQALVAGDRLDGGGGVNFLNLIGGGVFNLSTPAVLANISVVTASEASTPVIITRPGTAETIDLSPALSGGSSVIHGAADSDVFNLGSGTDTVLLGSGSEAVHAGSGTALVYAPAYDAGAVVVGAIGSSTTLAITSGGTATLASADFDLTVRLVADTHLSLGGAQFVTAIGAGAADTIVAGAANQTLVGGGGGDLLVGWAGFGDSFVDTAAGFAGDLIYGFGGNDVIDVTDLSFGNLRTPSVTSATGLSVLRLTDGVESTAITLVGSYAPGVFSFGADGHGGVTVRL